MEPIKYVCSLGALCFSAELLKRNKLKKCSYPFDWVFSTPNMIASCLEDDFKLFLDKSHHKSVTYYDKPKSTHTYYITHFFEGNTGCTIFNHHDITRQDDYYYFERCIYRFRNLLTSTEHKLFILSHHNNCTFASEEINMLNHKLKSYTTNYDILVINHKESSKLYHTVTKYENITYLTLYASQNIGMQLKDNKHNQYLDNILLSLYTFEVIEYPHASPSSSLLSSPAPSATRPPDRRWVRLLPQRPR